MSLERTLGICRRDSDERMRRDKHTKHRRQTSCYEILGRAHDALMVYTFLHSLTCPI